MKMSPAGALAAGNADASPDAIVPTESIGAYTNKEVEKKKSTWGGRRVKGAGSKAAALIGNEDSDSEATRKEKKQLAAKASKSFKNSQSMKGKHLVIFFCGLL
jgi:hypothetical protein